MKGQTNAWLKDIVSGEKISIALTTNQSSHTDLMGAVITVSYAGNLTEYTWEGSAIQTVIPPMMDYTVSYSNVNGYATPEPFSGKAMDGRVSEVIGIYNTEVVTVNVSAEEGEVSGYEIQISKFTRTPIAGYTELEYIEATGSQWLDTGYIPTVNTKLISELEVPAGIGNKNIFCASTNFVLNSKSDNQLEYKLFNVIGYTHVTTPSPITSRFKVEYSPQTLKFNDEVIASPNASSLSNSYTMWLFRRSGGSSTYYGYGKIYYLKIYDTNILVRDYVPVKRNSDGVCGLWDKVNETFYSSISGTDFVSGGVVGDLTKEGMELLYTQTTSTATYKFPHGTKYTIKASDVSGYTTPESQTFTASESVRDLGVVYNLDLKGVWIQDVNGKLWAVDDWDNSVAYNGVAIITDKHSFVLAPKYITGKSSNFGAFTYVAGVTTTTDITIAQNDFNGYENTQIWIEAGSTSAGKAAQYIFPNGQNGYLPSAGEAQMVLDNLSEVMKAATITAGYNVTYIDFVTSTQCDSDEVWYLAYTYQSDGTFIQELTHYEKTVSMRVWAAAQLK